MHQTFYIDVDEEITSIVDRMRKSPAEEIVLVVPKRSILIQSIVNLKILKKQSENLGKNVIIVTQDKLGKSLVEKAGISVQTKMDDFSGDEIFLSPEEKQVDILNNEKMDIKQSKVKANLDDIGTEDYFGDIDQEVEELKPVPKIVTESASISSVKPKKISKEDIYLKKENEKIVNKELVKGIGNEIVKKEEPKIGQTIDLAKKGNSPKEFISDFASRNLVSSPKMTIKEKVEKWAEQSNPVFSKSKNVRESQQKLESFFSGAVLEEEKDKKTIKKKDEYASVNIPGKFGKFFLFFGLAIVLAISLVAIYFFLPKADIKVMLKNKSQTNETEIIGKTGKTSVEIDGNYIPAKIVSLESEVSNSYSSTGSKSSSDQKARGMVTIYNEFGTSPQNLVATTRLEDPDGKIFRLVKSVNVPGMTKVGDEMKPGAIEAEVVADQSGDAYNIGPTNFTIPGFKENGEKYKKFYAKSSKSMAGGGSGGNSIKSISNGDLSGAKMKISEELKKDLKNKLNEDIQSGEVILDEAMNPENYVVSFSNLEGEVVDNFTATAKGKVSAIVFSEKDAKEFFKKKFFSKISDEEIRDEYINLNYGKAEADFAKGEIIIRVNAKVKIVAAFDEESFRREIAGKNDGQVREIVEKMSQIEGISVEYSPAFLFDNLGLIFNRMPYVPSNIKLTLDTN